MDSCSELKDADKTARMHRLTFTIAVCKNIVKRNLSVCQPGFRPVCLSINVCLSASACPVRWALLRTFPYVSSNFQDLITLSISYRSLHKVDSIVFTPSINDHAMGFLPIIENVYTL